ncbi:hypothetical protein ABB37_08399 [Leptomonas pyrrhocoris]|uniref:Uncharacterized protein n=1 Tax=Leptomonas pyrrhocoris TaxID=157538 RepID=A0A0N0VDF5_LEPPY|nr:hypothetical protein ABB37_08399 [Leptomonas pyrrhocoris]KPA75502.1 hypothetical protein ABB37_08399 [Leptomonas pyrrhocoris]|eukprot:XP_015653941.1 hypothetical protein ABB37_08399 [Leptomonas pyrrhocoris]
MPPRPLLLPLCVAAALLILGSWSAQATLFLANTTASIRPFSKLQDFCQSVNDGSTVVAMNVLAIRNEVVTLMNGAGVGKAYVSATYDLTASPPSYFWIIEGTDGVTTKQMVSPSDFVNGVTPVDQLPFVLYSTDPSATGLIPFSGLFKYPVVCTTNDATFTTLPPTTAPHPGPATTTTTTRAPSSSSSTKKGSNFPWWAILILVLGIVAILVVVAVVVCCCFFECVMEDELPEEKGSRESSDSLQGRSDETRTFGDHLDDDDLTKSPRHSEAEGSVGDTGTSYTKTNGRSGSPGTATPPVFTEDETPSSYSGSEASVTRSSHSSDSDSVSL